MFGDNKANEQEVSAIGIKNMASDFSMNMQVVSRREHTKEEILFLAGKSQEITDALNALYEQMKGN